MFDYIRDPAEIYRRSFEVLRAAADFSHLPDALVPMAERLIHACGMPEIAADIAWGGDAATAAAILGFPVGFIGAAESKDALIAHAGDIPFVTLKGRLGGSAIAAAAVNALLIEAQR